MQAFDETQCDATDRVAEGNGVQTKMPAPKITEDSGQTEEEKLRTFNDLKKAFDRTRLAAGDRTGEVTELKQPQSPEMQKRQQGM